MKKRLLIIVIAFGISFISMVGLSLFSLERFNIYANYSDLMDHSGEVIDNIYQAEMHLRDIDRSERGYMITRDTMYIRFLNNAIDSINCDLKNIQQLTSDNQTQIKNLTIFRASVALRINKARDNIAYCDTATNFSLNEYKDSRNLMQECSREIKGIHILENKLRAERLKEEQIYLNLTAYTLKYLLLIFCVITLILFLIMIKELKSRVRYQEELQARVIDLRESHNELQEIAYVASHDLQEPLRKIQVFSNMLLYREKTDDLDEESNEKLVRINNSANQMQLLISDLMSLTSLTKIDETKTITDLNKVLKYIITELDDKIKEKNAIIELQLLPIINGYDNQLRLLFKALLDNSLKFTRPGVKPVITITSEIINGHELSAINPNLLHKKFHRITVSDNGIGFDNQFMDKIFGIFQRLHAPSEYEGKGIGLAICQRIMANHEGYIMALGEVNMGAKFKLFFPVED